MKKIYSIVLLLLSLHCTSANAFFFFWFPTGGSTSDPNSKCASESASAGQNIVVDGKQYQIKSIEGTSSMCKTAQNPILVKVELVGDVQQKTSNAKIELDDGWSQRSLNDIMKSGGGVLYTTNKTLDAGLLVSTADKQGVTDVETFVNSKKNSNGNLTDVVTTPVQKISVNGVTAYQFQKTGKVKAGNSFTYLHTWFDASNALVLVNVWTTSQNFENVANKFQKIALSVTGLEPEKPTALNIAPANTSTDTKSPTNPATRLKSLKELLDKGLITKEEFDAKKAAILKGL
jgi:Short C-terminal domain